eukprot:CAMPEP_0118897704 /NCGR_PEP_ID=MMETSP1166-20130328/4992_1 /TAXON_ID=1104430 /ORGANISM="Chrysoreinhardia sp, Strain CCMP3193" /LENGTH=451 /DNA_ID=CAMNT_0006836781 /DNA_START=22 /DNA_END=1378 /DNA_ORIENTATION=+
MAAVFWSAVADDDDDDGNPLCGGVTVGVWSGGSPPILNAAHNDYRARRRRREAALYFAKQEQQQQQQEEHSSSSSSKRKRRRATVSEHVIAGREPTFQESLTVQECVGLLSEERKRDRLSELGLAWVVDDDFRLRGYVGTTELLLSAPSTKIGEISRPATNVLTMEEPLEEAMLALRAEDLAVAPVVDGEGVLVAALAPSEVIDVLEQEATEDVAKIALSGSSDKTYFDADYGRVVRDRAKWLLSLLMFQSLSSVVLDSFSGLLSSNLTLAFFLTMITGTSGNAGNQSSAVVIRGLATGEIVSKKDALKVLKREFKVGIPLALVLAGASFLRVVATTAKTSFAGGGPSFLLSSLAVGAAAVKTALAITIAMGATVFSAIAIGAGAPLLLDTLGVDPANCASPTLATFVDLLGVLLLCTISSALLPIHQAPTPSVVVAAVGPGAALAGDILL